MPKTFPYLAHTFTCAFTRTLTRILSHILTGLSVLAIVMVLLVVSTRSALAEAEVQVNRDQILLVHFDATATREMREAYIAQMGGELVTWMPQINVAEIRLPAQDGVTAASLPAMASEMVAFAEVDLAVSGVAVPNDPDFSDAMMSYGLTHVQALAAWDIVTGSQEIVIAVVDSGVQLDHPEFAGRLVAGYDFINQDNLPYDDQGHGTHIAGVIAAALNNGQGVAGVCPNCRIMPVKVLNQNNVGSWSHLAQGILFAVDHGAQVINLSLGATMPSQTLASAIDYALSRGVMIVAAAGNNGSNAPFYPAALEGVIAVGATNSSGQRWSKSNFGSYIDLTAPGELIYSTYHDANNLYRGYTYMSGTSMAAPFVSGVVGLLLSVDRRLTREQVTEALVMGAEDLGPAGWDSEFGHGRVSAMGALRSPVVGLVDDAGNISSPHQRGDLNDAVGAVTIFLPALGNN